MRLPEYLNRYGYAGHRVIIAAAIRKLDGENPSNVEEVKAELRNLCNTLEEMLYEESQKTNPSSKHFTA